MQRREKANQREQLCIQVLGLFPDPLSPEIAFELSPFTCQPDVVCQTSTCHPYSKSSVWEYCSTDQTSIPSSEPR
ncbi:hypothetical protein CK820_G0022719 [Pan troglodytes]|uniref:Uncharacterized protein n=1 Tax=Pan troglodytes TaxID=9598 RepID=A0A2J8M7I7_PANTR|nr:hypothetical protein CK820_G0022719 [Pan troglodytes]